MKNLLYAIFFILMNTLCQRHAYAASRIQSLRPLNMWLPVRHQANSIQTSFNEINNNLREMLGMEKNSKAFLITLKTIIKDISILITTIDALPPRENQNEKQLQETEELRRKLVTNRKVGLKTLQAALLAQTDGCVVEKYASKTKKKMTPQEHGQRTEQKINKATNAAIEYAHNHSAYQEALNALDTQKNFLTETLALPHNQTSIITAAAWRACERIEQAKSALFTKHFSFKFSLES